MREKKERKLSESRGKEVDGVVVGEKKDKQEDMREKGHSGTKDKNIRFSRKMDETPLLGKKNKSTANFLPSLL